MMLTSLTLLLGVSCGAPPGDSLEARLTRVVGAHKGKVAIAVKHLATGESYCLNADEVMPSASLIKLPILLESFLQVVEGKIKLTDTLTLREADKVPGSGILTENFSEGTAFPLRDAMRLMTVHSDNTATNLVLDRIGIRAVNARMAAWGLKETRLNAKVFRGCTTSVDPARTKKYGLGSTTAREMVTLLDTLMTTDQVKPAAKQAMLTLLQKCEDREKFPRLLPRDVVVAHKTGSTRECRTAAGLINLDVDPVALCVLTAENKDTSWGSDNPGNLLCANVAREVYTYFTTRSRKP